MKLLLYSKWFIIQAHMAQGGVPFELLFGFLKPGKEKRKKKDFPFEPPDH